MTDFVIFMLDKYHNLEVVEKNFDGFTLLMRAAAICGKILDKKLLEKGANPTIETKPVDRVHLIWLTSMAKKILRISLMRFRADKSLPPP